MRPVGPELVSPVLIDDRAQLMLYSAFLAILLVSGNIGAGGGGEETTGKIYQFEMTENNLFY